MCVCLYFFGYIWYVKIQRNISYCMLFLVDHPVPHFAVPSSGPQKKLWDPTLDHWTSRPAGWGWSHLTAPPKIWQNMVVFVSTKPVIRCHYPKFIRKHQKTSEVWYSLIWDLQAFFGPGNCNDELKSALSRLVNAHISAKSIKDISSYFGPWNDGLVGWCQVSHVIPWNTLNYTLWLFVA